MTDDVKQRSLNPFSLALLRKAWREARWLWLGCGVALLAFCSLHVYLTSRLDTTGFQNILESIPPEWEAMSPVPFDQLLSYSARIALCYEEPLILLILALWCISRSSDIVSGEIGRGSMELLFSQPISRVQILTAPVAVSVVGAAGLAVVAWCGSCLGIALCEVEQTLPPPTIRIPFMDMRIPLAMAPAETTAIPVRELVRYRDFLPAIANFFTLSLFFAGLTFCLSTFDRYRWRTIGIAVGWYIFQLAVELMATGVKSLSWLRWVTVFGAYDPVRYVLEASQGELALLQLRPTLDQGAITWPFGGANLLLGTLAVLCYAVGYRRFLTRDIPAPSS